MQVNLYRPKFLLDTIGNMRIIYNWLPSVVDSLGDLVETPAKNCAVIILDA